MNWGVAAGHAADPAGGGMLVTMMEYRQPVAFPKAVRLLACRRDGLVRRTIHRKPAGHAPARLSRWVTSSWLAPAPSTRTSSRDRIRAGSGAAPRWAPLAGPPDELKELADTFDAMLARLDAAFASQRQFVANASHELRTPPTEMRTLIDVTTAKPAASAAQLEPVLAAIGGAVDRTEELIGALLTLARSDRGPGPAEAVDLPTAVEDAIDLAGPAAAAGQIQISTALQDAQVTEDRSCSNGWSATSSTTPSGTTSQGLGATPAPGPRLASPKSASSTAASTSSGPGARAV
jgi:signal transduction histidine kinase